ncbi:MAG: hypothetical protein C0603_06730 [Denitrovibrio sp.]|nr:MAG: hypothetical protein C0603_06730 [Denitrovibrio sp.]
MSTEVSNIQNNINNPISRIDAFIAPMTAAPSTKGREAAELAASMGEFFKTGVGSYTELQKSHKRDNERKAIKDHFSSKYELPDSFFNTGMGYEEAWHMLDGKTTAIEMEAQTNKMLDELKPEAFDMNQSEEEVEQHATQLYDDTFKEFYTSDTNSYALIGAEQTLSLNKAEYISKYMKKFKDVKKGKALDNVSHSFRRLMDTTSSDFPLELSEDITNVYASGEHVGLTKDEINSRLLDTIGTTLADEGRTKDLQWLTSTFLIDKEQGTNLQDTKYARQIRTLVNTSEKIAHQVSENHKFKTKVSLNELAATVKDSDDWEALYTSIEGSIQEGSLSPDSGASIMKTASSILTKGAKAYAKSSYLDIYDSYVNDMSPSSFLKNLPEGVDITKKDLELVIDKNLEKSFKYSDMGHFFYLSKRHNKAYQPLKDSLHMSTLALTHTPAFEASYSLYKDMKAARVHSLYMDEKTEAFYKVYDDFRGVILGDGTAYSAEESFTAASKIYELDDNVKIDSETARHLNKGAKGLDLTGADRAKLYKYAVYFGLNLPPDKAAENALDMFDTHSYKIGSIKQPVLTSYSEEELNTFLSAAVYNLYNDAFDSDDFTMKPDDWKKADSTEWSLLDSNGIVRMSGYTLDDLKEMLALQNEAEAEEAQKKLEAIRVKGDEIRKVLNKDRILGKDLEDNPYNLDNIIEKLFNNSKHDNDNHM